MIDKQTGGKYADKVDTVQQKAGEFVDSKSSEGTASEPSSTAEPEASTAKPETSAESEGGLPGPRP